MQVTHSVPMLSLNNAFADDDSDLLSNLDEYYAGTLPLEPDTDGDGLDDGTEVLNGCDPLDSSSNLSSGPCQ